MIYLNVTAPQGHQGSSGSNLNGTSKWKMSSGANIGDINPVDGYFKFFQQSSTLQLAINVINDGFTNVKDLLLNFKTLLNTEDLIVAVVHPDDDEVYRTAVVTEISNAYSTGSGMAVTITGTILTSNGSFVPGQDCVISLGVKGIIGVQGYRGHQGHQGFLGIQGVQGVLGVQGAYAGYPGSQGAQGYQGLIGPTGFSGEVQNGAAGPPGFPGNQGPQGGPGPQGPAGDTGPMGYQGTYGGPIGDQGEEGDLGNPGGTGWSGGIGAMGPQGYQGAQGPWRGYRGHAGFMGNMGVQGNPGIPGPQGGVGSKGYQGYQGFQGYKGTQGLQGYNGSQGVQGEKGFTGILGAQGAQGPDGYQGHLGYQGYQGIQGVQGTQGYLGNQGYSSAMGAQGNPGNQGSQGYQGNQGNQGYQGFQGIYGGTQGPQGETGGERGTYTGTLGDSTVSLLLHMDGANNSTTFTDNSFSPKTLTAYGNAKISTAASKFGGASASFDGNGTSSIQWDSSSDFDFASADFTVEGWVNLNSLAAYQTVFGKHTAGVAADITFDIMNSTTIVLGHNSVPYGYPRTVPTISTGVWYHFAISRASGIIKVFWNGQQVGDAHSLPTTTNGANRLVIGKNAWNSNDYPLNGYVDEFRITKGVARYTSNFTPSATAFPNATLTGSLPSGVPVGYIVHSSDYVYVCSNTSPMTWKRYPMTASTSTLPPFWTATDGYDFLAWRLKEIPGSTTFVSEVNPGATTDLTIPTTSRFRSGVDDGLFQKTVTFVGNADNGDRFLRGALNVVPSSGTAVSASMWIKPYSNQFLGGATPIVFGKLWHPSGAWSNPYNGIQFSLDGGGSGNKWGTYLYLNGVGHIFLNSSTTLTLNQSILISLTYDGNYIRIYENGILVGTSANYNGASAILGYGPWYSGKASINFPGHSYDGQIWDIRVANTVRSAAYYRAMYLAGTGTTE